MDGARLIDALERQGPAVVALARAFAPDDARWRPPDSTSAPVEVLAHLLDEEREDFRARVQRTLADPAAAWDPIDPEGAAVRRSYIERDLVETTAAFAGERLQSVAWLRTVDAPDWHARHEHPVFGPIRAGDVLAAWVAHDALHIRQLAKHSHQIAARDAQPFDIGYAGRW